MPTPTPAMPAPDGSPDTLQQKVSQYRSTSGQLEQTSQAGLQDLAAKAGLPAVPISAVAAGMIGANPDQQKMAAAPQTVQSSLQASQLGSQSDLATAQREKQASTIQSSQDQSQAAKAQQLSSLGDTGSRVQSAIDAAVKNITATPTATQTSQVQPGINTTSALFQGASNQAQLTTDLQALQANPGDAATLASINQDLGRNQTSQLSQAELQGLYQDAGTTITNNVAAQMPTNITVGQIAQQPGFQYSMDQLGTLLGVPAAQLQGYSMSQLSNAMSAEQQKEFSRSQQIDQAATSQNLGQAEKNTAQLQGRDLAAQGVRSTEDDVAKLQQSVANGDKVQFGGQTYTVEDLLGNQEVSKAVSAYLNAPAGSDTQTQLQQTEPDLINYINAHQAILSDAVDSMAQNVTGLAATQTANAAVGTYGQSQLDATTLKALIPGYDSSKIDSSAYDTSSPVFAYLGGLSPTAAQTAAGAITTLSDAQKTELASLSPSQIAGLQLNLGTNSPVLKALTASQAAQSTVQGLTASDPDSVVSALTGITGMTAAQAQAQVTASDKAYALGLTTDKTAGGLDMNGDGTVDSAASMIASMQKQVGSQPLTIAQAEAGKSTSLQPVSATPYDDTTQTPAQQDLYAKLQNYVTGDTISSAGLQKSGVLTDPTSLQELVSSGMTKNMDTATQKTVTNAVSQMTNLNTANALDKYPPMSNLTATVSNALDSSNSKALSGISTNLTNEISGLQATIKSTGTMVDNQALKSQVTTLQNQLQKVAQAQSILAAQQQAEAQAQAAQQAKVQAAAAAAKAKALQEATNKQVASNENSTSHGGTAFGGPGTPTSSSGRI